MMPTNDKHFIDIALGLQASAVYGAMTAGGSPRGTVQLDRQLCFYDDLFGWARIAFTALVDRPPPDTLFGPTFSGI